VLEENIVLTLILLGLTFTVATAGVGVLIPALGIAAGTGSTTAVLGGLTALSMNNDMKKT